jgi:hypothetical protein
MPHLPAVGPIAGQACGRLWMVQVHAGYMAGLPEVDASPLATQPPWSLRRRVRAPPV